MKRLLLFSIVVVLTWGSFGGTADPPANPPVELSADAKAELLRIIAAYPKPEREAILEVLNNPDFLKKLDPKSVDLANLAKILAGQPEGLRKAIELLAANPEIVDLLQDDPDYYLGVAREFAKDRPKIIALMEQVEKDDAKAVEEWTIRLEENQAALDQLQKAATAFAAQPGGNVLDSGFSAVANTPANAPAVNVHTLPTPLFIRYVMANADKYPDLSNTMVSQWLSSNNPASYDASFQNWWGRRGNFLHDTLLKKNADRSNRLAELAKFDRQHANVDVSKRYEQLNQKAKDFPHLAKLPKPDPKRQPLAQNQKPKHRDPHPAGKDPHPKPHKGTHTKAHHKHSPHHHLHHGKAGHHHHANKHHHGGKGKGKGKK